MSLWDDDLSRDSYDRWPDDWLAESDDSDDKPLYENDCYHNVPNGAACYLCYPEWGAEDIQDAWCEISLWPCGHLAEMDSDHCCDRMGFFEAVKHEPDEQKDDESDGESNPPWAQTPAVLMSPWLSPSRAKSMRRHRPKRDHGDLGRQSQPRDHWGSRSRPTHHQILGIIVAGLLEYEQQCEMDDEFWWPDDSDWSAEGGYFDQEDNGLSCGDEESGLEEDFRPARLLSPWVTDPKSLYYIY